VNKMKVITSRMYYFRIRLFARPIYGTKSLCTRFVGSQCQTYIHIRERRCSFTLQYITSSQLLKEKWSFASRYMKNNDALCPCPINPDPVHERRTAPRLQGKR
jgi:hypothetical protein